jgi:iron complex outermembrane receptor protein
VADSSGAVVPKAKVVVRNQGTGAITELTTNDFGVYKAALLTPGKYTIHLEAAGFKSVNEKDVEVRGAGPRVIKLGAKITF